MSFPEEFDVFNCPLSGRILIEASAGTGKTWNIGGLYLRLLLEKQLEVKQILVVTFTRAATAELRDRIRGRIAKALSYLNGVDDLADDTFLLELLGRQLETGNTHAELTSRLQLAFESFDQAAIFTIHSFASGHWRRRRFLPASRLPSGLKRSTRKWCSKPCRISGDATSPTGTCPPLFRHGWKRNGSRRKN